MFTSREIATIFWIAVIAGGGALNPDIRDSYKSLFAAFFTAKILGLLMAYALYISGWTFLAYQFDFWNQSLLKDTTVWFIGAGFPLIMKFGEVGKDPLFFRRAVRSTVAFSVFAIFFINTISFGILTEIGLQFILSVLAIVIALGTLDKQVAMLKRPCEIALSVLGLVLFIYTAIVLFHQRYELNLHELLLSLLLTIWLPIVALPFIYGVALFGAYEGAFMRMKFANDRKPPNWKSRLALVVGLRGDITCVNAVRLGWARRIASPTAFRVSLAEVRAFIQHRKDQLLANEERQDRLERYTGVAGNDDHGRRLDQRQFAETRDALRWLSTCHMGWYRRINRYRPDLLELLGDFSTRGLPSSHGISMRVSDDGQAWYAWRRTVSGWTFAIGAANSPPDIWLYDGPTEPTSYPSNEEWDRFTSGGCSKNWEP